ncbi:SGNH/GDSL hydrolase family protein [Pararhizobium sp. LjRoot238]|uniref:SGNH/GDSL hydrolase family protein n=1 Tax=Pararhizobium sp. LjRoot238 TaxID=3342293 RepID=UPI003ECDCD20
MANDDLIRSGTASVANGSLTVTGQTVAWTNVLEGDFFGAHVGLAVPIAAIAGSTITLAYPWPGATQTAIAYAIQPKGDVTRMQDRVRALLESLTSGALAALATLGSSADKLAYFPFSGIGALADFPAYARGLVAAASDAAARTVLGLGNVNNTSDANKPVSTAQAAAIAVVRDQITSNSISKDTWAALAAQAGTLAGQGAEVLDTDTGTHTDPVVGGTVPNAGRFSWSTSPAGWKRIGATGLTSKVDKTALTSELGARVPLSQAPWLHKDAIGLIGLASALAWDTASVMVAKAIKSLTVEGSAVSATDDYYIGTFCNDDPTYEDQIIIRKVSDNSQVASLGTTPLTKSTTGPTEVLIYGTNIVFRLLIDYRDISSTGILVNLATRTPLIIGREQSPIEADRVARVGFRLRNAAFDPAGAEARALGVFQGSVTLPKAAAANAALTAHGVVKSHAIGTGTTATAFYKRDAAPASPNGKYIVASVYIYSAGGTNWPSGSLQTVLYSALTGGSVVSGATGYTAGYVEVTSELRRYWAQTRLPASGTIGAIAYGFASLVSGAVAEIGGWTLASNDVSIGIDRVQLDDWNGFRSTDAAQANSAARVTALQNAQGRSYPWNNGIVNPVLDVAGTPPVWTGTATLVTPAATEMSERGIKRALQIGSGGALRYKRDAILSAASSQRYFLASAYVYAADGAAWPDIAVYWYAGGTFIAGLSLVDYIEITSTVRLYFVTGQLPNRTDMTEIRMGPNSASSSVVVQVGGYSFISHTSPLTIDTVARDDWYPAETSPEAIHTMSKQVAALSGGVAGSTIAFFGDSVIESYGVPEALATALGATVLNFGMGGCRMARLGSPSGAEVYRNEMSMVSLAEAIQANDFAALTSAADSLYSGYADDNRVQAALMASTSWAAVNIALIAHGTNDWSAGVDLGAATSTTNTQFYGALNLSIAALQAACPNMQIVFLTPQWRASPATLGDSNLNANGDGVFLSAYADAIADRSAYHHLPVIDLLRKTGVNQYNYTTYYADGLHPTVPAGRDRIVSKIAAGVRTVL